MNHKEIAELAHVSESTVSKALSGSAEISKELADKIKKIAIEQGYFKEKNKRKREYTNNNSIVIGVIVPEVEGLYYSNVVTQIKRYIEANGGYAAIYIFDFDDNKKNKIIEMLILNEAVDGIIIFSQPVFSIKPNIPVVVCNDTECVNYDSVRSNMTAVLDDAVRFLKDLGHSKMGFVGERNTIIKSEAFIKALKNNNLPYEEKYMYIVDDRFEEIGIKASKEMLASNDIPTALIAAYDEIAMALIHELSNGGVNVPDDISVMGINNISSSLYSKIPLTTVETFSSEKYRMAVDMLFDKIINETTSVRHICIEHKIISRDTTRKVRD